MRHAFAQVAERRGLAYGIEVPTTKTYRFKEEEGAKRVHARHDLVFLARTHPAAERQVLVELKEGQPARGFEYKAVRKDFVKLLREPAAGKSFVHVVPAADSGTVPTLISKYSAAYMKALTEVADTFGDCKPEEDSAWFSLFVLVARERGTAGGGESRLHAIEAASFGDVARAVRSGSPPFREPVVVLSLRA